MSKRRIENEINKLSDEALGELTPDTRLRILLKARADGREEWIDRLLETCPRDTYQAFAVRDRSAYSMAFQAVYELHTSYLRYKLVRTEQVLRQRIDDERDEEPSDEELEQFAERANEVRKSIANLYTLFHGYQRFATEVLGVNLEVWLALHPNGLAVLEAVSEVIGNQSKVKSAESYLNETLGAGSEIDEPDQLERDEDRWRRLNEAAERWYERQIACWRGLTTGVRR